MERYTLTIVAPIKLKGLKAEIESINNYCGKPVFLKVEHEINDLNQLENYVSSSTKSEFLLVFESLIESRANLQKAQEELLEKLRKARFSDSYSKIIVILQSEKEDEGLFINELIKLDIQDFFFVNDFSKDDIAGWLFSESRTLKDNLKYLSTNISKTEVVIKEVPKYIEVPVSVEESGSKKSIYRKEKEAEPLKQEEPRAASHIIGVIGASHGTGATSLCVNYASFLKEKKKKVLLLDRSENMHLSKVEIKGQDIKDCPLYEINIPEYDYIIIDFGLLADIDCSGKVVPLSSMKDDKRIERQYCHEIILTASSLPWRLFEINTYIEHTIFAKLSLEWIFYVCGEKNTLYESLKKAYEKNRMFLTSYEQEKPYFVLDEIIESRGKS